MLNTILSPTSAAYDTPATSSQFNAMEGFPHIVIDGFLQESLAREIRDSFPPVKDEKWINYLHYNEKKFGLNKRDALPPRVLALIDQLNSPEFLRYLSNVTGIQGLMADPSLEGGGLHQSGRGGFLNIHADFTAHPHRHHWRRRVNLLIYMNDDNWQEEWGGQLELWTRDMKRMFRKVAPLFNRAVIFNTDKDTFHGHPEPMTCPEGVTRKSIALYYFTEESANVVRATNYKARPHESVGKHFLVRLDVFILSLYNRLKGALGIDDKFVSNLLRWLRRGRK